MQKTEQNFKNHVRLVPGFHYITYGLSLFSVGYSIWIMTKGEHYFYIGSLGLLLSVLVLLVATFARTFGLKAQDRAIRAEESFRYFVLTGKPLPKELRLGQIIALRFASDEEYPTLVQQALESNMKPVEIKKAIKNWRGDYHRV